MMRILFIITLLFICIFGQPMSAWGSAENEMQEQISAPDTTPVPLEFDKEKIESLREDPDFDYSEEVEQETWWTRFKRYLSLQYQRLINWLFGEYQGNAFILLLVELIPYLVIGGILIFAIWLFIRLNPAGTYLKKPKTGRFSFNEEEEIVQSRDINRLIAEAVAANNYRLAVRYYYLLILQQLSETDHIVYAFPKTNEEYAAEIGQDNVRKQFRQITRIYDFIWYGSFDVTAENFQRAEREFKRMQENIEPQHE